VVDDIHALIERPTSRERPDIREPPDRLLVAHIVDHPMISFQCYEPTWDVRWIDPFVALG